MKQILIFLFSIIMYSATASISKYTTTMDTFPYHEIPEYPDTFTQATVLARMIDGLGFRYYWATDGLRLEDYDYKASAGSRTTRETMEHILGLVEIINNTVFQQPNIKPRPRTKKSDYVRRRVTLKKLRKASDYLKSNPNINLDSLPIIFQRGENISEVTHWHLINGPLADALWHCGQIIANRRASGNPISPGVNMFSGKREE